jgi:membrane associated rhomboid family serine protease
LQNYDGFRSKMVQIFTVASLTVADVAFTIYHTFGDQKAPRISWAAHASGALIGLLIGIALLKNHARSDTYVKVLRFLAVFALLGLCAAALACHFIFPPPVQQPAAHRLVLAPSVIMNNFYCCPR